MQTLNRCRICGEKLRDPKSIQAGIGPVCAGKLSRFVGGSPLRQAILDQSAQSHSPEIEKIRTGILRAVASGRRRDIEYAERRIVLLARLTAAGCACGGSGVIISEEDYGLDFYTRREITDCACRVLWPFRNLDAEQPSKPAQPAIAHAPAFVVA